MSGRHVVWGSDPKAQSQDIAQAASDEDQAAAQKVNRHTQKVLVTSLKLSESMTPEVTVGVPRYGENGHENAEPCCMRNVHPGTIFDAPSPT